MQLWKKKNWPEDKENWPNLINTELEINELDRKITNLDLKRIDLLKFFIVVNTYNIQPIYWEKGFSIWLKLFKFMVSRLLLHFPWVSKSSNLKFS